MNPFYSKPNTTIRMGSTINKLSPTQGKFKMSDDTLPTVNHIKAVDMMKNLSMGDGVDALSPEDRTMIEDAIEADLDAESQHAANDEARLTKLEGQVHAQSEAIIAIAQPSDAVDGAVQTVKDKM